MSVVYSKAIPTYVVYIKTHGIHNRRHIWNNHRVSFVGGIFPLFFRDSICYRPIHMQQVNLLLHGVTIYGASKSFLWHGIFKALFLGHKLPHSMFLILLLQRWWYVKVTPCWFNRFVLYSFTTFFPCCMALLSVDHRMLDLVTCWVTVISGVLVHFLFTILVFNGSVVRRPEKAEFSKLLSNGHIRCIIYIWFLWLCCS